MYDRELHSGVTVSHEKVDRMEWRYYHISVPYSPAAMQWHVTQTTEYNGADCDLYVQRGGYPTRGSYLYRDITTRSEFTVDISGESSGVWYAGVYGYRQCGFSIEVTLEGSCPDDCNGHGQCESGRCNCESGYSGDACEVQQSSMETGHTYSGSVETYQWQYYQLAGSESWDSLLFTMQQPDGRGDCDLYVRANERPSLFSYDAANVTTASTTLVRLTEVQNVEYHVGVYGYQGCSFTLRADAEQPTSPSDCPNRCSLHGSCSRSRCQCRSGFTGDECERMVVALSFASPVHSFAGDNAWNFYTVRDFSANPLVLNVRQTEARADCDLYVRRGQDPTRFQYDLLDISNDQEFNVTIAEPGDDVWHIGVYGWYPCEYTIQALEATTCDCPPHAHGSCPSGSTQCVCDSGYAGDDCTLAITPLSSGLVKSANVAFNQWQYYQATITSSYVAVVLHEQETEGFAWLFVSQTAEFPSLTNYDAADQEPATALHYAQVSFPTPQTYTYTIGVYGSPFNTRQVQVPYKLVLWAPTD